MSQTPPPSAVEHPLLKALRVCIVAENASFSFGGEASLPLQYFMRLRQKGVETWLIVHGRTQRELQALFPNDQDRIQYIPDRWYHRSIFRLGQMLPRRISEASVGIVMVLINQFIQRGLVRRLVKTSGINVVHQPMPVSPKAPSFIWSLGVPVVIGPMNGGMNYPEPFRSSESLITRATVFIGRVSASVVNRIIAGKRHASVLLVANQRTREALSFRPHGKIIEMPENGVDLSIWSPPARSQSPATPPRFVFIGRLVDWKRLDFAIQAMVACPDATLEVIGDGPMRDHWVAMAKQVGVGERVVWHGWLPQLDCARRLHGATALVLPSIYECGGAVVLEAMACGVPVIALSWGGPAEYIDSTCGILIPPTDEEEIIKGFAKAQKLLATDRTIQSQLGKAGRRRVELHFDWNRKVDKMLEVYCDCIGKYPG